MFITLLPVRCLNIVGGRKYLLNSQPVFLAVRKLSDNPKIILVKPTPVPTPTPVQNTGIVSKDLNKDIFNLAYFNNKIKKVKEIKKTNFKLSDYQIKSLLVLCEGIIEGVKWGVVFGVLLDIFR